MTLTRILSALFTLLVLIGFTPVASAHYDPSLGRWIERDPAGYVDGSNSFEYSRSNTITYIDSFGTNTYEVVSSRATIISWIESDPRNGGLINSTANPAPAEFIDSMTANHPPFPRFGSGTKVVSSLGSLKSTKEYRNIHELQPRIKCCKDTKKVQRNKDGSPMIFEDGFEQNVGYTPQPFTRSLGGGVYFGGRAGTPTRSQYPASKGTIFNEGDECVSFWSKARFQVGYIENFGQAVTSGTFKAFPYAWSEMKVKVCCDGTVEAKYWGSVIPSFHAYLDGQQVGAYSMGGPNAADKLDKFRTGDFTGDAP